MPIPFARSAATPGDRARAHRLAAARAPILLALLVATLACGRGGGSASGGEEPDAPTPGGTQVDFAASGLMASPVSLLLTDTLTIDATIMNTGVEASGSFVVRAYLKEGTNCDFATFLMGEQGFDLMGGASAPFQVSRVIDNVSGPGTYYVCLRLDAGDEVMESDETNNWVGGTSVPVAVIDCATALDCDDGNPCTDDLCLPVTGCSNPPNTLPCEDGLYCTVGDTCASGRCEAGVPRDCADVNLCDGTLLCDEVADACVNGALPPACDDGDPCNGVETCNPSDGLCLAGTPSSCDAFFNNGQAPPLASNVIDDASYDASSGQQVLLRDLGCPLFGEPDSFCPIAGAATIVEVEAGADVGDLRVFDTSTLIVTDGDIAALSAEQDAVVQIAGGRIERGQLDGTSSVTGGAHPFLALYGDGDVQGGAVADLELSSALTDRSAQMTGGVATTLFLGNAGQLRGGRVSVVCARDVTGTIFGTGFDTPGGTFGTLPGTTGFLSGILESGDPLYTSYRQAGETCFHPLEGAIATAASLQLQPPPSTFIANGAAPPLADNVIDGNDPATAFHDVVVRNAGCPDGWPAATREASCASAGSATQVETAAGAQLPGELLVLDTSLGVVRGGAVSDLAMASGAIIEVWGENFAVGGLAVAPGDVVDTSGVLTATLASGDALVASFDREDPSLPGQYGTLRLRAATDIPSGSAVMAALLGGAATPGGVEVDLDVEAMGTLVADHELVPLVDLPQTIPDAQGLAIAAGGIQGQYHVWQIAFTGGLEAAGTSRLTLSFDPVLVGPGQELVVFAWDGNAWQRMEDGVVIDAINDTIAFEITGFDYFALIIRDVMVPALSIFGIAVLVLLLMVTSLISQRRRRAIAQAAIALALGATGLALPLEARAQSARQIPECDYAALHSGRCVEAFSGRLAYLTDASDTASDACAGEGGGGGPRRLLCRYEADGWREVGPRGNPASGFAPASATQRVLHILNPPAGSGLVPPVGDGIDGQPQAPRTDDGEAISAAIQYACDNGYDIAYLGPGVYRIGAADTSASFYTGVRIDAQRCPGGIKFYGAGAGRTVLLANGNQGQYIVFTTDEYSDPTRVLRIGFRAYGWPNDVDVTSVTTGVSPPVVTGSRDPHLEDGDLVAARNCSGAVQMNERRFRVANCTQSEPYSCELQDEQGVDIDATEWGPWTPTTGCILNKLNPDFEVEIAYMTLRDDAPVFHAEVCDPNCMPALEQSHGIGILQGGGHVEVHHLVIDGIGDEAIDVSAPEASTHIHDIAILDPEVSGVSIYQGVGIRVEDVFIFKGTPWAQFISTLSEGDGIAMDPGSKNWRIVDVSVERAAIAGGFRFGVNVETNSSGYEGQYISGIQLDDMAVAVSPAPVLCVATGQVCGSVWIKATDGAYVMEDVEVRNSQLFGSAVLNLEIGAGGVTLRDNDLLPIPGIAPMWGVTTSSIRTNIVGNTISGFERGCILYQETRTNGGANATVTTEITANQLTCDSNPTNTDSMIASAASGAYFPAPGDEAYLRIRDNVITASAGASIQYGAVANTPGGEVEVCNNQVQFDPGHAVGGAAGFFVSAEDAVVCNNTITLPGSGVRVSADRAQIVGNQISGIDAPLGRGVWVVDASNVLVKNNVISDYDSPFAVGIEIEATMAAQSGNRVVGNQMDTAGIGIEVDGNGVGQSDLVIAGNRVDLEGGSDRTAIQLEDATQAKILLNDLVGLSGSNVDALLTTGTSDFNAVRDNVAEGGGTLRYGTGSGDASCNASGGVGANSTCADNTLQ